MGNGVVSMDVRLQIALAPEGVNVAEFCRKHEIGRDAFYLWRGRFEAEGLDGLEPRSRAPLSHPHQTPAEVEDLIVALRKELDDAGLDAGPATIHWHLTKRYKGRAIPSTSTVWRVLKRRGFVIAEPRKRPQASFRRFEASAPNELWQADCIDWVTASGPTKILSFIDDHCRVALRVKALVSATSDATWDTFCEACEQWGTPLGQLTDNGLNFSGRLRGFEVRFETELRNIGVVPKTSRPYHPQTCGKVERFQQTLKKWLRRQPLAADLVELQAQLDRFVDYYNHQRPHRGIGNITPAERWAMTPPAINLGIALPSPTTRTTLLVAPNGLINVGQRLRVNLGTQWAGQHVEVRVDNATYAVFAHHTLIRAGTIDPDRRYEGITDRTNQPH
jgi:transposase InsO family protein